MKIYLVDGKNKESFEFINEFGKELSKDTKTLIIQFKRENKNIEDLYDKGGMITYDICDYFLENTILEKIINKESENLHFIISPFLENKYQIKKEDIKSLLDKVKTYENIIIYGLDSNLIEEKTKVGLIDISKINDEIDTDYFALITDKDYDIRLDRDIILSKKSKFLGLKTDNSNYELIISNLLNDTSYNIDKLGFLEKIKLKFRK